MRSRWWLLAALLASSAVPALGEGAPPSVADDPVQVALPPGSSPALSTAYNRALQADSAGPANPQAAAEGWAAVGAIADGNPYRAFALERALGWRAVASRSPLPPTTGIPLPPGVPGTIERLMSRANAAALYAAALAADAVGYGQPHAALNAWKAVIASAATDRQRAYAIQRAQYWWSQPADATAAHRRRIQFGTGPYDAGIPVSVEGHTCVTPCVMELPPGRFDVVTSGSPLPRSELIVPESAEAPQLVPGHRALLVTGAVIGGIGVAFLATYAVAGCAVTAGGCGTGRPGLVTLQTGALAGAPFMATGFAELVAWGLLQDNRVSLQQAGGGRTTDNTPAFRLVALGAQPTPDGIGAGASFSF